jgi:hypothetical protein
MVAVSSCRYQARNSDEDLRIRLVELAREKLRYGYRRLHVLLRRSGEVVNYKRVHRIYRGCGCRDAVAAGQGDPGVAIIYLDNSLPFQQDWGVAWSPSFCWQTPTILAPSERAMEFRLVYSGQLLGASRNDSRSQHKHDIRKIFRSQLKTLWEKSQNLREWDSWELPKNRKMHERLAAHFVFNGVGYVPLS